MNVSLNSQPSSLNRLNVWDGDWAILEEYTTGNVLVESYVQGYHGLVKTVVSNIYYYQDELGSTSHVASASGALLEYYKYDLYGKPTYWSPTNSQLPSSSYQVKDLFTGQRWIPELGLYDDRNRFMSPDLGRFLQPDPIGFKGDASNLYRYCGNDWANRSDPMGTDPDKLPLPLTINSLYFAQREQQPFLSERRSLDPYVMRMQIRDRVQDAFNMEPVGKVTLAGQKVAAFDNAWAAGRYGANQDYQNSHDGNFRQEYWGTIQKVDGKELYAASASKVGGQKLEKNETKPGGTVHSAIKHEKFKDFTMVGWHYSHIRRGDFIKGHEGEIQAANTKDWMRFGVVATVPSKGAWDNPVHQGYDGSTRTYREEKDF